MGILSKPLYITDKRIRVMNIKASLKETKLSRWFGGLLATATMAGLSSCSMMTEDLDDCPWGLYVNFKYDYNIERADIFKDQVGGVTLYVFDDAGKLVERREVTNAKDGDALKSYGYKMHFTDLPAGKYKLYAMGMQKGYDETLATDGAKSRRTEPQMGDAPQKLQVRLDRSAEADVEGRYAVEHENLPMDTLWMSREEVEATVEPLDTYSPTYATVPLIRNTKRLNVSVRQIADPMEITADDFDYYITDANGLLSYNNEVLEDQKLKYTPYKTWTTTEEVTDNEQRNAAHAEFNFNRLIDHNDANKDARLVIINKKTRDAVLDINLPAYLAEGRAAFEMDNYSAQEYLDRQHDYTLDLYLDGSKWIYMDIKVLSWSIRKQNVDL